MLQVNQLVGFGAGIAPRGLIDILTALSLTTNLEVCLDAGDADSYTSGQSWLDRSGNGFDFFRGADGSVASDDPTFNGTAGNLTSSEYFSFDGGDFFRYDTTNETWMENLHKDNATFSMLAVLYAVGSAGNQPLIGDSNDGVSTGVTWFLDSSEKPRFSCYNAGSTVLTATADTAPNLTAWNFMGLAVDESGASGFHYLNGAYNQVSASDTFTATYSSPSAGASGGTMEIGADSASAKLVNTSRLAMFAAWEGSVLTKANFDSVWGEVRERFGL